MKASEFSSNPGAIISYKDALLGRQRASHSSDPAVAPAVTQRNDHVLIQLKGSLRDVLRENPDGINLPHLRQLCPLSLCLKFSSDPAVAPAVTQRNDHVLIQLKSSLRDVLRENPDGINLPHLRQLCPLLVDPEILRFPHPSIRHLLVSLNDVVKLQGIGVQTLVLPAEELNIGPRLRN